MQIKRTNSSVEEGKMDYKDFVWFVLSEEDKGNDISLDYWFRCIDLDDDGCLRSNEMNVSPLSQCGARQQMLVVLVPAGLQHTTLELICLPVSGRGITVPILEWQDLELILARALLERQGSLDRKGAQEGSLYLSHHSKEFLISLG